MSWTTGEGVFFATLVHRYGSQVAEQDVSTRVIDDRTMIRMLRAAGFEQTTTLTSDDRWIHTMAVD
jgi:hypothetical protein